ncbi:HvfC/BufC family peptide modification chaperone [Kaarinaea lacus]
MNTLHNLQHNFVSAVFEDTDNSFSQSIMSESINGARRLQIYHNNIYISLTNALSTVYPVVNRLVGDDFFRFMATEYIKKQPSRSGNLHDFGNQLASFIENFTPAKALVYLSDVARLEWAYHIVFHEDDCPSFDVTKLEQVSEEYYNKLIFTANPASQLINSPYPILRIWQKNQDIQFQDNDDNTESGTIIRLDEGETRLLIIRRDLDIEFQTLEKEEYAFLDAIYNHSDFFTACDAATTIDPECNISKMLLKHIQTLTLVDFQIRD